MGLTLAARLRRTVRAAYRAWSAQVGHPMSPDTADYFGYPQSASGVAVDERLAMGYAAVWAAIRLIAETTAQLPIGVYEQTADSRQPHLDHPACRLLNGETSPEMGAFTFRETITAHVAGWGNGYAEIERTGGGIPVALHPLAPDRTSPIRRDGRLYYEVRETRGTKILDASDVLHIAGLGFDGIKGYSPIRMHANAIGHGMAQETYSSRFFGNGSSPGGFIELATPLQDEAAARKFIQNFEGRHAGPDGSHRIGLLDGGAKFNPTTISPEDSQLLDSRKFSVNEIARIFRVPPHMIGDLERATFANIEQQSLDFLTFSLMPWLVRWEQEINRKLILPSERNTFFAKHQATELLRADMKTRYESYAVGRQWGWLSADDVRHMENQNPLPAGQGRLYLVPMNMTPANQAAQAPPEKLAA